MTPNRSVVEKLLEKCKSAFDEFQIRKQKFGEPNWAPTEIEDEFELHCFIERTHLKEHEDKPVNAAFTQRQLSTRAEGGPFGRLSKIRLFLAMEKAAKESGKEFVGAVKFRAGDIRHDEDLSIYKLVHDPLPFEHKGSIRHQDDNHVEIVCHKDGLRRDKLRSLCRWSLRTEEVAFFKSVTNPTYLILIVTLLLLCVLCILIKFH